jgi:hypothetical protein
MVVASKGVFDTEFTEERQRTQRVKRGGFEVNEPVIASADL